MKKRLLTYGIVSTFFLVLITGFALASTTDACSQEITITENSGENLTGYQVPIYLDSSNFNFSQANEDGSDLRFSSGGRSLNYWIETWDPEAEKALIWVRIPFLLANSNITLLMKCGDSEVTAVSSGEETFDFFDGFEDDKLQSLLWRSESAGGGLVEVEDGICKVSAPKVHAYDSSMIYSKASFDINSMFVVKRMKVTTGKDERGPLLRQGFIDQISSKKNEIQHETELGKLLTERKGTTLLILPMSACLKGNGTPRELLGTKKTIIAALPGLRTGFGIQRWTILQVSMLRTSRCIFIFMQLLTPMLRRTPAIWL
jgi:hypothetical protein